MALTPVKSSDFLIDRPLPWNVYDANGTLMFASGSVIDEQIKGTLIKRGVLREVDSEVGKLQAARSLSPEEGAQEVRMALSEAGVRPGETVHLVRDMDSSRLVARLIGYLKNKSTLITIPADRQGAVYLKEGEAVFIKVFSGKHVLAFPCSVLSVLSKPFPHIHLSYPADVAGFMVRRSERASVHLIAAIDTGATGQAAGVITDLSTGGFSIASRSRSIATGTAIVVDFKIELAGIRFLMKINGIVRAIRANQNDVLEGAVVYGVQFKDMAAEDSLILGLYVKDQLFAERSAAAA